jgi:hypothetical protein
MKTHSFKSHSPEENRKLSNLGHLIEGMIFAFVSILALLSGFGVGAWADKVWQVATIIAGLLLLVALYASHPRSDWLVIWRNAQQRQHTLIAVLVMAGGVLELISITGSAMSYAWPGALLLIGFLFLVHKQHGTSEAAAKAVRQHQILGVTIILSGFFRAVEVFNPSSIFSVLWALALLAAAIQLITYREPEGAYESESSHHQ